MIKYRTYTIFAAVVVLVQVLLLNNLALSPLLSPVVYMLVVAMMPIEWPQWRVLIHALLLGLVMDVTMGTAGLNVLATLPIAFLRRPVMHYLAGVSEIGNEEGIPSPKRLGVRFYRYVVAMVALQGVIFYGFEGLSLDNVWMLLLRMVLSIATSLCLVMLLIVLFLSKINAKS